MMALKGSQVIIHDPCCSLDLFEEHARGGENVGLVHIQYIRAEHTARADPRECR